MKTFCRRGLYGSILVTLTLCASDTRGDSGECQDHEALLQRIERLEALVEALQQQAPSSSPEAGIAAPAPEIVPFLEDPARRQSRTFHAQAQYLPSRGWNADWQGLLEKRFDLRTFIDLEFIDPGPDGSRGGSSTFDTHHVQVFLDGQLNPRLSAHAELEWEHSGDELEVDQAYIAWALTDWMTLDLGRFYTPFGIERFVWYSPTNALVSRPQVMREIVPGNFYANGVRVAGVVGEGTRFAYEAAVSNGLGDDAATSRRGSRQNRDNNSNKAVSGRVSIARNHFEVGASYHRDGFSSSGGLDLEFVGLDVSARYQGFEWRGEYVEATVERLALADLEQRGWYGQLSYTFAWDRTFLPSLTLVGRYDDLDLDRAVTGNDDRRSWSLGLNSEIYRNMRLKGEYQIFDEDGPDRDDNTFYLQAVITF